MDTKSLDVEGLLSESGRGDAWSGLSAETVIGHMHLHVANLAETQAFYVGVLEFDIMQRYGSQALFVSAGGYHHHIGLNTGQALAHRHRHQRPLVCAPSSSVCLTKPN